MAKKESEIPAITKDSLTTKNGGNDVNDNQGAADAIANDGEYIVIVNYGSDGETVEGYSAVPNAELEAVIMDATENGSSHALATFQNDEGNFQIAESQYDGVIYMCCVIIVAALFMCLGAIASRTLLKSFER